MNIPVIRPAPSDPLPLRLCKQAAREACHLPVRLRMAVDPAWPWLVKDSVRLIESRLSSGMRGFEWGSGRSTIWLSRRLERLVSLEHKAKWARRVREALAREGRGNVDHRLAPEGTPSVLAHRRPALWEELGEAPRRPGFASYFDAVLEYPEHSFDIVLIDGRARVECALNAASRVRPGGMAVLDNSEWPKYEPVFRAFAGWTAQTFENGVWATTVFTKPAGNPPGAAHEQRL